ncbi:hypothetical protein EPUL_000796 [Erysiphe pulchra]|uniref:MULE transposase domain-containing protein n=1 Tax=Erysiphe pulchra TaxID=225359 RepID=A0A2S4Q1Q8_9PEZI|nr:hypothetical protein EPUL_000796 [Erysiphe pulchra]
MDINYKAGRVNLPLLNICVVTGNNLVVQIGLVFLSGELESDYEWALYQFHEVMEEGIQEPAVVVTDRETTLMKPLDRMFPNTAHLLCRWHVNINVLAKCKKFFPGPVRGADGVYRRHEEFKEFLKQWNSILLADTEISLDTSKQGTSADKLTQCQPSKDKFPPTTPSDNRLFVRLPQEHEWRKLSPAGNREVMAKKSSIPPSIIGKIKPVHTGFALSLSGKEAREDMCRATTKCRDCGGPYRSESRRCLARPTCAGTPSKESMKIDRQVGEREYQAVLHAKAAEINKVDPTINQVSDNITASPTEI